MNKAKDLPGFAKLGQLSHGVAATPVSVGCRDRDVPGRCSSGRGAAELPVPILQRSTERGTPVHTGRYCFGFIDFGWRLSSAFPPCRKALFAYVRPWRMPSNAGSGPPAFVLSPRGRACPQPPILERHSRFPNTPCSDVAGATASFIRVPACRQRPRSAKQSLGQSPKSYALPDIRFPCDTLISEAGSQTKSDWQPAELPMPCLHTRSESHAQNSYFGNAGRCCNVGLRLLSRHRHDDGYDA